MLAEEQKKKEKNNLKQFIITFGTQNNYVNNDLLHHFSISVILALGKTSLAEKNKERRLHSQATSKQILDVLTDILPKVTIKISITNVTLFFYQIFLHLHKRKKKTRRHK